MDSALVSVWLDGKNNKKSLLKREAYTFEEFAIEMPFVCLIVTQ